MEFRPLGIDGAWEITLARFGDPRGEFMEVFKEGSFVEAPPWPGSAGAA